MEALILPQLLGHAWVRGLRILVQEQELVPQVSEPAHYTKQLAQHAAMEVSRLPILANEIEVQ
jgi:hypothetical protein